MGKVAASGARYAGCACSACWRRAWSGSRWSHGSGPRPPGRCHHAASDKVLFSPPTACARTPSSATRARASADHARSAAPRRLRRGRRAADPGAAEHRRRLVQPGDRRMAGRHGSTNNTFHINGQPFANRTAAFDPGVLQAETIAQAAERGGKKVAQIEWAGGRGASINGPTVDFRGFFSGRGVATNYIVPTDDAAFVRVVRPAVRPPGRLCRAARLRRGRAHAGDRLDKRAGFLQPGAGDAPARARLRDRQVRPERLYLRLTDDGRTNYDRVLFSPTKDGDDERRQPAQGEWADVKVKIVGGGERSRARPPACWSRSSGWRPTCRRCDCSTPR